MKRYLPLMILTLSACGSTHDSPTDKDRGICNDIFNHTDECLVDVGCQGVADRRTYVDQCLTMNYTANERDRFVASSCDAANAGACTAATSFYRDNCDCAAYTTCPASLTCTDVGGGQAACLTAVMGPPDDAPACDKNGPSCGAGWGCAFTSSDAKTGLCAQFCAL